MDGTLEAIFFEVASCATIYFNLGFDYELLWGIVSTEGTGHIEGLLFTESYLSSRYGHPVPMHDLCRLVLMQNHRTLHKAPKYVRLLSLLPSDLLTLSDAIFKHFFLLIKLIKIITKAF